MSYCSVPVFVVRTIPALVVEALAHDTASARKYPIM